MSPTPSNTSNEVKTNIRQVLIEFYGERYCGRCEDIHGILDEDEECLVDALATIEKLLLEVIGNDENHIVIGTGVSIDMCDAHKTSNPADCNCPAGERNDLRREQRTTLKAVLYGEKK